MPVITPAQLAATLRNIAETISQPVWHDNHPGPLTAPDAVKLHRIADRIERSIRDDDSRLDAFTPYAVAKPDGTYFFATPPEVDQYLADARDHWSPGRFLGGLVDAYEAAPPLSEGTVADIVRMLALEADQTAAGRVPVHAVNDDGQLVVRFVDPPSQAV
ncbi:hypothetical protein [Frankia sp. R82]|uniref:hypothetical protein n=1 Tax=Frankia sp. R82 TaxID=2950553 RepID=UPI0020447101|nr:hypothetical protein [Frankia sp. R82]MCM3886128.1 hypothetical protein [Frankia sp. R82]